MIDVLNDWMLQSSDHFNVMVGVTMVLYVGSLVILYYVTRKFGKPDERTNAVYLKIISCMFTAQLVVNGIFISWVDRDIEYFRQIFILFQGIVFLVGAIYSIMQYRKDFK
jgi:hypothetical protein